MYAIKPIIDSSRPLENFYDLPSAAPAPAKPAISLTTITAQVQKIHASQQDGGQNTAGSGSIAQRRAKVLHQLDELNRKLDAIHIDIGAQPDAVDSAIAPHVVQQQAHQLKFNLAERRPIQAGQLPELILNADPDAFIPYGLLAVRSLWRGRIRVLVKTFTHSSIGGALPEPAQHFNRLLATQTDDDSDSKTPALHVTLIWKRCQHVQLLCAAAQFQPIVGEANALRFLYRSGPPEFSWPEARLVELFALDGALDTVHRLAGTGDSVERAPLWAHLVGLLNARPRFGAEVLSVADVAVASAVRQFAVLGNDKVPTQLLAIWKEVQQLAEYGSQ